MADYESFDEAPKYNGKDDFPGMITDLIKRTNWKVAFFLFILGVLIFSDVFINLFLISIKDAVEGDTPTQKGTIIQLVALTIGYVICDLLVQGGFI